MSGGGVFINLTNYEGNTTQPQHMVYILREGTCGSCYRYLAKKMVIDSEPERSLQCAITPEYKMSEFNKLHCKLGGHLHTGINFQLTLVFCHNIRRG